VNPSSCVVLVPTSGVIDSGCEQGLQELERRGYSVRRISGFSAIDFGRYVIASEALRSGFEELMWIDADVVFHPDDIDRLRAQQLPLVCGIYSKKGRREYACVFQPGTESVVFGKNGGLLEIRYAGSGFLLTRREVYDTLRTRLGLPECNQRFGPPIVPWFLPMLVPDGDGRWYLAEDFAFCERARQCGLRIMADTRIRLYHVGSHGYSWEDPGHEIPRYASYTHHFTPAAPLRPAAEHSPSTPPAPVAAPAPAITPLAEPGPLRPQASPLPAGFPRLGLYVITYAGNENSLAPTLANLRASDWKEEPVVFVQPADWPRSKESASRNYRRALEQAAADGCDFAVILEDDVRVGRWFRQNLTANPLIRRDQCDYLGLFMPDLIASPWDRAEVPLGYRLARPLYSGPNRLWEKHRIWGSQGYALSRRLVLAALERWQRLAEGQDTRVISVCSELKVPLWYTAPCLIEHAPLRSEFNTPAARAVDFDPGFRLEPDPGFQPPEAVPGWLTVVEGRALWTAAAGRQVLELGTGCGRATVCLAQSAQQVLSVDIQNQAVAAEWVRRYGTEDRVEFHQGDAGNLKQTLAGKRFGLAFIDTEHDAQSVRRDLESVLGFLEPGGLLAFHDYPDPGWPDVRRVVDEYVVRCGWERVAQADYLGLFRTK